MLVDIALSGARAEDHAVHGAGRCQVPDQIVRCRNGIGGIVHRTGKADQAGPSLVDDVKINWVWMPPWGPDKITEDGREQLRALGFRV